MTHQEKIDLAEKEVSQAEIMMRVSREKAAEWENLLDLRRETLASLELPQQDTRSTRKPAKASKRLPQPTKKEDYK